MNEGRPGPTAAGQNAITSEAAFTIARMPALIASGNSRPAAEVPVVTPSPLAATDSEWPTI